MFDVFGVLYGSVFEIDACIRFLWWEVLVQAVGLVVLVPLSPCAGHVQVMCWSLLGCSIMRAVVSHKMVLNYKIGF